MFAMCLPRIKYSGGKIVPHLDLWMGTTLGVSRQDNHNNVKVLQWNAGGLNHARKAELHKTLENKESDFFVASMTEETLKYFHLKNFNLNLLPKSRKSASGILIRIHQQPKHTFSIVKGMNDDEVKIIILQVWKNDYCAKVSGVHIYNPPQNNPAVHLVDMP